MIYRIALFALLTLFPAQAFAASRVWISEYETMAATGSGGSAGNMAALPAKALQPTLDISGGAQTSAIFGGNTKFIRVVCEVQCAIRADGVTATTSSILMPALSPEYYGVLPGSTISVIAAP